MMMDRARELGLAAVVTMLGSCTTGQKGQAPPPLEGVCDANGAWSLKLSASKDDECSAPAAHSFKLVMRANGDTRVVSEDDGFIEATANVTDVAGDCIVDMVWWENAIAAGTPDVLRYDYHLVATAGRVSGTGRFADVDDESSTAEQEVLACETRLVVAGEHRR